MHFVENGQDEVADLFFRKASETGQQARIVHDSILQHEPSSGDRQFERNKFA